MRLGRRKGCAYQNCSPGLRRLRDICGYQDGFDTGKIAGSFAGEEVIEGKHRVGLATTKVGLQLHNRIAACPVQTLQSAGEQVPQTLCQEGALKEVAREAILNHSFTTINLAQICGKFGLLVATGGNVGMGCDNLAPGTQAHGGLSLDGCHCDLARFTPGLLIKTDTQHLLLLAINLAGLFGRDSGEQSLNAVQCAVDIVGAEGFLVCPPVASLAQLTDQAALCLAKDLTEDGLPLVPHDEE